MGVNVAFRHTPSSALKILINITPLEVFVKFVAHKRANRLMYNN